MGIIKAVRDLFSRRNGENGIRRKEEREERIRRAFTARIDHFSALLSANKSALADMADLEEALRGDRPVSLDLVRANCAAIIAGVSGMVRRLDALSGYARPELLERIADLRRHIADSLSSETESATGCRDEMPSFSEARRNHASSHGPGNGPLVLPLEQADFSLAHEVGAKMAGLGEAAQKLGRTIPAGFVVTASGFRRFLEANSLQAEIERRQRQTDFSAMDAVFALASDLRRLILSAEIPDDLAEAILFHYRRLETKNPGIRLAVRSSAIGEDAPRASFAGQYRSELNVPGERLLQSYKDVLTGKYGVPALTYRIQRGISDAGTPMCVGCLEMIDALAGGVAYSADPLGRDPAVVINSVPGLPGAVVDGSGGTDVFRVSREEPGRILERRVALKSCRLESAPGGGLAVTPLTAEEGALPSLTDGQITELAAMVLAFEEWYGLPQDVEWAYDREGRLVVLQSRTLPDLARTREAPSLPEGARVLLEGGVSASPGVGAGELFRARGDADMLRFPDGAVLLLTQAHARWAPLLHRASAVLSEHGGAAGHLASLARECGVPALFGLGDSSRLPEDGALVTVDADSRQVLAGRAEEPFLRERGPRALFAGSPAFRALEKAAGHIVPLTLLDPESPSFTPEGCRTLHDVIRFCHQKSVEEMFRVDETLFSGPCGKQLVYRGGRLQYFVVNIGNGFCSAVKGRHVGLEEICCPPMHALWQGMIAVPWSGPPETGARGFLALVAESAVNPDLEVTRAATRMARNYFMVDREYCRLQAGFGYHFCTVEARAGEKEQENYVNFHCAGGGAAPDRRLLRAEALAEVLGENGFRVKVRGDVLTAQVEDLSASEALKQLGILGYLIIHTRQMDAILRGEADRVTLADSLRKGIGALASFKP